MKVLVAASLALLISASGLAQAGTVTGQVTYIGPLGDLLILNRDEVYAVAPDVSLANVSVKQNITVVVSDQTGAKTITALYAGPGHNPETRAPASSPALRDGFHSGTPE
jgi:hypothetical protein